MMLIVKVKVFNTNCEGRKEIILISCQMIFTEKNCQDVETDGQILGNMMNDEYPSQHGIE